MLGATKGMAPLADIFDHQRVFAIFFLDAEPDYTDALRMAL